MVCLSDVLANLRRLQQGKAVITEVAVVLLSSFVVVVLLLLLLRSSALIKGPSVGAKLGTNFLSFFVFLFPS